MNKILFIGSSGAGKSTAAKYLHELTGLPLINLDQHYWKPDWVETPKNEWDDTVRSLCSKPQWIMDGNYGGTLDYRIAACDTIFFLHYHRLTCLHGVLKRRFLVKRIDDIPGCPERIDFQFFSWIWNYNKTRAPQITKKLENLDDKTVYIVKNRRQLHKLFKDIKSKQLASSN